MVIYGGNRHTHYADEICYDDTIYAFNMQCNTWTVHRPSSRSDYDETNVLARPSKHHACFPDFFLTPCSSSLRAPRGRFHHRAFARNGQLVIHGGFSGRPLADILVWSLAISAFILNYFAD